ncbi:MAG: hypothetical protein RIB85_13335 [Thalassobaculum sp.]
MRVLRRYLAFVFPLHLLWEFAHLPLYTIWHDAGTAEVLFAAVHCTGGDLLIAMAALLLALMVLGNGWPVDPRAHRRVAGAALIMGIGYTVFSEWLNIEVRGTWEYSALMPVLPPIGTGLSPILQWIAIPLAGFGWAYRPLKRPATV